MSSTIKTVTIAGASGSLGRPVTQALLEAGFTVTALTRSDSKSTFPTGVTALPVDYSSVENLTTALRGQDALISTLASAGVSSQTDLINAAVAAGVKRIIPSEFGSDTSNARARALPVFKDKVETAELVERLSAQSGGKTTYTFVLNGAFLDWGVERSFLVDVKSRKYDFVNGGNTHFTSNPLPFVAKAVVAILQRPEATTNKTIRLQAARLTQREFLAIVQRVTGTSDSEWTVTESDSQSIEKEAFANLKADPSNALAWTLPMLRLTVHADGFGGDFGEAGERDNELLGLKGLSREEIEKVIGDAVTA